MFTKVLPINVTYGIGSSNFDSEGRTITLEFKDFVLVAVYVPNAGHHLSKLNERIDDWEPQFLKHLCTLREKLKKPVVVAGDMNVAHKPLDICDYLKQYPNEPCYTREERQSFTQLLSRGFKDTFRELHPGKI